jgi:flagellin-like hook-associated protein FlgL
MSSKNRTPGVKLGQVGSIRKLNRELAKLSKMNDSTYENCFMDSILTGTPLSVVENAKRTVKDAGNFLDIYANLATGLQDNLIRLKSEYETLCLDESKFDAIAENVSALEQEFDCLVDTTVGGVAPLNPADTDASGSDVYQLIKGVQNLVCPVNLPLYAFRGVVAPTSGVFGKYTEYNGTESTFQTAYGADGVNDLYTLTQDASDNILIGGGSLEQAVDEIDDLIEATGALKKSLGVYNDIVDNNVDSIDNQIEMRKCAIAEDKADRIDTLVEQIEACEIVASAM